MSPETPAPNDGMEQLAQLLEERLLAEHLRATPLAPKPAYDPAALSVAFDNAHAKFLSAEGDARARFVAALERFLVTEAVPVGLSIGLDLVPGGSTAALMLGLIVHEGLPILQKLEASASTKTSPG